jgi:hypothetical protein
MAALWRFYLLQLEKRPLTAKAVSSAIILGGGDLTSQLLLKEESWDYRRYAKISDLLSAEKPRKMQNFVRLCELTTSPMRLISPF